MNLKYKTQTSITNLYLSKTENSLCLQKQSEKVGSAINKYICTASHASYQTEGTDYKSIKYSAHVHDC
jgi:hypothetical protein